MYEEHFSLMDEQLFFPIIQSETTLPETVQFSSLLSGPFEPLDTNQFALSSTAPPSPPIWGAIGALVEDQELFPSELPQRLFESEPLEITKSEELPIQDLAEIFKSTKDECQLPPRNILEAFRYSVIIKPRSITPKEINYYLLSLKLQKKASVDFPTKRVRKSRKGLCLTCNETHSPEWRKGPQGPATLCNACGLRWKKLNSE